MPLILTWNNSGSGGSGGSGTTFANASTLSKFSETAEGKLLFNGKIVGENAATASNTAEVAHYVTLTDKQTTIELPDDCDTSQAIILAFNGMILKQDVFWEVIEKNSPEKDLIAWNGLELETLAQEGDSILITYYRKA